jgi:hypothetical protein
MSRDWVETMAKFQPKGSFLKVATYSSKAKVQNLELQFTDLLRGELSTGLPAKNELLDKYANAIDDLERLVSREPPH